MPLQKSLHHGRRLLMIAWSDMSVYPHHHAGVRVSQKVGDFQQSHAVRDEA